MAQIISEIRREGTGNVVPGEKLRFDVQSQTSPGIVYNPADGVTTFDAPGVYSVKWWVATETTPRGIVEFVLASSLIDKIPVPGSSPIKTGQVSGFGVIDVKAPGVQLWLESKCESKVIFSIVSTVKAYMLITRIQSACPSGLVGVYHANLSAPNSSYEITIGNVVYRLQYSSTTAIALQVRSTEGIIVVDIKRSSQYGGGGAEGLSLNNYNLTTAPFNLDGTIYNASNEMHRTWIRQQDPVSGLWSMYEVDLFASSAGERVSICVYQIYEDVDLTGL